MKLNNKINIAILLLILASCSVEKRCARHISKAKEMGCLSDTVVIKRDTIKGWQYDTIFRSDTLKDVDTFTVNINNTEIKTVVRWKDRLIAQSGNQTDTILIKDYKTFKEILRVEKIPWWVYLVFCLGGVVILGLVFKGK